MLPVVDRYAATTVCSICFPRGPPARALCHPRVGLHQSPLSRLVISSVSSISPRACVYSARQYSTSPLPPPFLHSTQLQPHLCCCCFCGKTPPVPLLLLPMLPERRCQMWASVASPTSTSLSVCSTIGTFVPFGNRLSPETSVNGFSEK